MTISAPSVPAGGKTQPRKKSKINRWDSPWLNTKFIAGLLMVGSIMLLGVIGPLFWDITLSYPASSPLNLPPVFAPGYGQTAEQIAAEQAQTETASSGSLTGGNPFKKQEEAKPSAGTAGSLVRVGTPTWAHPLGTESNGRDNYQSFFVDKTLLIRFAIFATQSRMVGKRGNALLAEESRCFFRALPARTIHDARVVLLFIAQKSE